MNKKIAAIIKQTFMGAVLVTSTMSQASVLMKPTPLEELNYQQSLLPQNANPAITKPQDILGFDVGKRTATPEQIEALVKRWAKESNRIQYQQYATSYEGRPLHLLAISTPENLAKIDEIKGNVQRLANPSGLSDSEVNKIIDNQPAIAWMAYSIHGNESSGADASLALIYHLIASNDPNTQDLLKNMVVLVDPMMNPDGRARFTKMLEQHRATTANVDNQSLLHSGAWPYGRTNHYYYDLNRDFYFLQAPETKGRVKYINQWYPQLMIDGHEMGSLDTFLFAPAREPINKNLPASKLKWGKVFANEQADAFDKKGWRYYTGEWFENLYPGYSNYAEYRGAIHILYEQARTAEDGVRLQNDQIRTYQQSVHHQLVSSLTNLKTLTENSKAMYKDFVADRKLVQSSKSPYAQKSYVILPTDNKKRLNRFVELLRAQNIEVLENTKTQTVKNVKEQSGKTFNSIDLPKGAIVINARQPEARLLNAILEFDAEIGDDVLLEEWQRTLRDGSSLMYDNTAWNLTMLYGLDAWEVGQEITKHVANYNDDQASAAIDDSGIAWLVNGVDDGAVSFAARLMEQGVKVRAIDKEGQLGNLAFPRGSVVVIKSDNPSVNNLSTLISAAANDSKVTVSSVKKGLGEDDFPDIGGSHFTLLERPQVAIVSRNGVSPYDFGATWHMMDTALGIRHSHISLEGMTGTDLRRYNVIILPHLYTALSKGQVAALSSWVKQGGTLIGVDGSTKELINQKISNVAQISEALKEAAKYDLSLQREWMAHQNNIPNKGFIDSHNVPEGIVLPWFESSELKGYDKDKLATWNEWSSKFMPSGAIVAGRTDQKHWLTFGVNPQLPLLISNPPLLMSDDNTEAVIRIGLLDKNAKQDARKIGWSTIPKGYDIKVRMSGLLWPEAAQRIANAAYLTRERAGQGQVILFADKPIIRGATKGTERLLLNAIVYGPGFGTSSKVNL